MNRLDTGALQLVCQSQNYGDIETYLIATSLREEGNKREQKKPKLFVRVFCLAWHCNGRYVILWILKTTVPIKPKKTTVAYEGQKRDHEG